jgi:hypothetical protein
MKTLFLVASLLAGAAAVMAASQSRRSAKAHPTQTATVAAQGAGAPKPALKPAVAKGAPAPLAAPAVPATCHHSAPSPREAALHPCRMAGAGRTRVQCRNRRFRAS